MRGRGDFAARPLEVATKNGAIPMISWEPWPGPLRPIVVGERDAYIRRYATAAASFGAPLLLRFAHEMNLRGIPWSGSAELYRSAYQRVHAIFGAAGARNVRFVWSPYVQGPNATQFVRYYPGDAHVDWLALDGYNWGRQRLRNRWASFDAIFAESYRAMLDLAPEKPLMLAEVSCADRGGDKASWMRDSLLEAIPNRYPAIRAVVWFNQNRLDHADWRVDSSPEALHVWREAAADPRYSLTGPELLQAVDDRGA